MFSLFSLVPAEHESCPFVCVCVLLTLGKLFDNRGMLMPQLENTCSTWFFIEKGEKTKQRDNNSGKCLVVCRRKDPLKSFEGTEILLQDL